MCAVCCDQILVCDSCKDGCYARATASRAKEEEAEKAAENKLPAAAAAAAATPAALGTAEMPTTPPAAAAAATPRAGSLLQVGTGIDADVGDAGGDDVLAPTSFATPSQASTLLPPPPPSPPSPLITPAAAAAAKGGGVNFQKRLRAEKASVFLCTEHHLLSDGWQSFLDSAAAHAATRVSQPNTNAVATRDPDCVVSDPAADGEDAAAVSRGSGGTNPPDLQMLLASLQSAVAQLRAQLDASKAKSQSGRGRGKARQGRERRRRIELQMERIEGWLEGQSIATVATAATKITATATITTLGSVRSDAGDGNGEREPPAPPAPPSPSPSPAPAAAAALVSVSRATVEQPKWSGFFPLLSLWDNHPNA